VQAILAGVRRHKARVVCPLPSDVRMAAIRLREP
jgi:hypothetical protein